MVEGEEVVQGYTMDKQSEKEGNQEAVARVVSKIRAVMIAMRMIIPTHV
jgi:hypothetical protein